MHSFITAPTYLPTTSAHPLRPGLPTYPQIRGVGPLINELRTRPEGRAPQPPKDLQMQDSVNLTRAEVATSPAASEATSPLTTASPGSRNNPVERINAEVSSASSGDSTPAEPHSRAWRRPSRSR